MGLYHFWCVCVNDWDYSFLRVTRREIEKGPNAAAFESERGRVYDRCCP